MVYTNIVDLIMFILGIFILIFPLEYVIVCICGVFCKRKKYPVAEKKLKYGIIICARNEEKVIGNLIQSIKKSDYPQDKVQTFVIAHNCTDRTAEIARANGAIVYEYTNSAERTKGYALRQIFRYIERDYGIKSFDGYHVFDADNILDGQYLNRMNDAFLFYNCENAITSFRNAKNFDENLQTAMYGLLYVAGCTIESEGRMALNCSARILGSGFLVSSEMVKDGWNIVNLSDDTDFTAEQILQGKKVMYCGDAMYYDEHPTTFKAMWRQRFRWAKGTLVVCKKRFKNLFAKLFGRKKTGDERGVKFSSFDLIGCVLPIGAISIIVLALHLCLLGLAPLFPNYNPEIWKGWAILFAISTVAGNSIMVLCGIFCYVKERRLRKISLWRKILSVFIFPLFGALIIPLQIAAIFTKKFEWTQIVHSNESNFETFNSVSEQAHESERSEKMKIVVLSGGSGNDTMIKGLNALSNRGGVFDLKVIVNAYDNGKSTGVCRAVTNTLGVSDIRKNHSRMYQAIYADKVNNNIMEFYDGRFDFDKGREVEQISDLLIKWGMDDYIRYVDAFFSHDNACDYEYKNFSVSNIVYSQMYELYGYEYTNKHFCDKLGIDDFVVLNSFDNVYIKAQTESGHIIDDEGETVFWNNPDDKIVKTIYEVRSSVGLNPVAVDLVRNADLIIVSTGTFYSSLQPTIEYLDFYKFINDSKAKKIWVMNNEEDGDSFGVSDLELVSAMERTGLDLDKFVILLNEDANPTMKMTESKHNFVTLSMGNVNGKHDAKKYAKSLLFLYYGLHAEYDKILFDFDDTIYSRDSAYREVSEANVKLLNAIADKALIVSGNSYKSIREKLQRIYGSALDGWNVDIFADANSVLYRNDKQIFTIEKHIIQSDVLSLLADIIKKYDLKVETVGNPPVNYKIKPLGQKQREEISKLINKKYGKKFCAKLTGKTTVDIVSVDNDKETVFDNLNLQSQKTLYIGDEVKYGNDVRIADRCSAVIRIANVYETNLILSLLNGD